jgi:transglutaminase-like putative cysteine protease
MLRAALIAALAVACGPAAPPRPLTFEQREHAERWYRLTWRGAPVGWAVEREADGRITREEHLRMLRDGVEVAIELDVAIDVAADLTPRALHVDRRDGARVESLRATRAGDGWRRDGSAAVFAPPDAVPSELVPALVRMRGSFAGPVILAGWDLAVGDGVVASAGNRRLVARTVIGDAALDAAIELDERGNALAIVDSSDTHATRVRGAAEAQEPFAPVDVVAAAAIPLADDLRPVRVVVRARGTTKPPPAVPGQRVDVDGRRWTATLDPALPGALPPEPATASTAAEIAELAAAVHAAIEPSLAGNTAASGDCTAYAVAFAGYAELAGIPVKVVTGYVADGARLVRHRWNVAWDGARWITVDASQPETMAPRLGVALSDASIRGLAGATLADVEPDR